MASKSFSVRIFLQDGHAGGVKVVSKSKWPGRCLVIPCSASAQERDRKELHAAGVYLLVGSQGGNEQQILHVGAADPVCESLAESDVHEKKWSTAIIFTCREDGLKPAQFSYVALSLHQLLLKSRRDAIVKVDDFPQTEMNKAEKSVADEFLAHMLSLFPVLGVTTFEEAESHLDI